MDEGVVKYGCHWTRGEAVAEAVAEQLSGYRDLLYAQNFIGQYPNGIGFGNLSLRVPGQPQQFIITGTQMGHLPRLSAVHYTRVTAWDLAANQVSCHGPVQRELIIGKTVCCDQEGK